MVWRNVSLGFVIGLLGWTVGEIMLSSDHFLPRTMAHAPILQTLPQAAPPQQAATLGRYQMSTWVEYKALDGPCGNTIPVSHGAYILDTQTGRVWFAQGGDPLVEIGHAE
jgi:hypothetical protein